MILQWKQNGISCLLKRWNGCWQNGWRRVPVTQILLNQVQFMLNKSAQIKQNIWFRLALNFNEVNLMWRNLATEQLRCFLRFYNIWPLWAIHFTFHLPPYHVSYTRPNKIKLMFHEKSKQATLAFSTQNINFSFHVNMIISQERGQS